MEIRKLRRDEMKAAAAVHRAAFDERLPWLAGRHTPEEDQTYFGAQVYTTCQILGAIESEQLLGFISFRKGWIDQLYVLPQSQARGTGTALLDCAKATDTRLRLWTFQRNAGARRFYEKHRFRAVEQTDGMGNDEREPDVLYEWRLGK